MPLTKNFHIANLIRTGLESDYDRQLSFGIENVPARTIQAEVLLLSHLFTTTLNKPSFTKIEECFDETLPDLISLQNINIKVDHIAVVDEEQFYRAEECAFYFNISFTTVSHDVLNTLYNELFNLVETHGAEIMLTGEALSNINDMNETAAAMMHIIQKNIKAGKRTIELNDFAISGLSIEEKLTAFSEAPAEDPKVEEDSLTEAKLVELITKGDASITIAGTHVSFKTIQSARTLFIDYRGDKGASEMQVNDGLIIINDQKVAHFSYNGRLWAGAKTGNLGKKEPEFQWK